MMQGGIPDRFQQGDCGDGDGIVRGERAECGGPLCGPVDV
jgi:hypothetical protein